MARGHYLDTDNEPSSPQVPSEPECVVRYKGPLPPTQIRTIFERVHQKDDRSTGPSFLDILSDSTVSRVRRPHDRKHPAYARTSESVPNEVSPSLEEAKNVLTGLMAHTAQTIITHADRKAARLSRGASAPTSSRSVQGGVSKHIRMKGVPVRREHTSEDVLPIPAVPPAKSRLRSCATDPDISAKAGIPMDLDDQPVAGPSRPPQKPTFFKSRVNEPDYDFPTSTPTPPAKARIRECWDPSSSSSSSSLSGSSSSPIVPPGLLRHERFPRRAPTDPPAWHDETTESSVRQESFDISMMNQERTVDYEPEDHCAELPPIPYVFPPSLPSSSMPPPAPVLRPDRGPTTSFAAPSLTPVPLSLNRPFIPPSQLAGASQLDRPRASQQRQKVLGMRPVYGQSTKYQSRSRPFKVPYAIKKSSESGSGSGAGMGTAGRRSVSPVVPDPPYVAARVSVQQVAPPLEMTARRSVPVRQNDDEDEGPQDANSSADMWAALDDIEFT